MSAHFFFYLGLRFWEWHDAMKNICNFAVCPVGAPLGEEVTKRQDFKEAWCNIDVRFPEVSELCRAEVTFRSSPSFDSNSPLNQTWNPQQDSLIHYLKMGFYEFEIIPSKDTQWEEWMFAAKEAYCLYKRMFVALNCDAATHHGDCFRWSREANQQLVIIPYEDDSVPAQNELGRVQWHEMRATQSIFPCC